MSHSWHPSGRNGIATSSGYGSSRIVWNTSTCPGRSGKCSPGRPAQAHEPRWTAACFLDSPAETCLYFSLTFLVNYSPLIREINSYSRTDHLTGTVYIHQTSVLEHRF